MSETELIGWLGFFTMATFYAAAYSAIYVSRYLIKRRNERNFNKQKYKELFGVVPDHLFSEDVKRIVDRYRK